MQHILSGFPWRHVVVYIDDVLIMSDDFQEHLAHVGKVLTTLREHGVKVKLSKCSWFSREVEYLRHPIGAQGIRKPPRYVQKVDDIPQPSTVRQLREFLGLANFQRKFEPNFSVIQRPLFEKSSGKGSRKLVWDERMSEAFHKIKEKIREDIMLAYPDYEPEAEPLELYVDASAVGAGACLCQKQGEQCRVIAYASTSFAAAQTNYSTIEKELAALRWGVKTFRSFLMGVEFVIHTDHQPLIYLHNMRLIDSRMARTLEDLADFHFQIRYTPGRDNAAADCLSRLYDPDNVHLPGQQQSNPGSLPEGLFLVKEVSGGGDSLFDSLYTLLSREKLLGTCPQSSLKLRELLVGGELLEKPLVYGLTLNRAERRKLRLMQYPGQLPGVEVLFAFGRLFGCVVYVHYGGHKPVAYFPPSGRSSSEPSRVHLQCLSGIHYNPVHEMHYFLPPDVVDNLEVASDHKVSYGGPVLSCRSEDLLSDEEEPEVLVVCSEVQFCPVDWCTLHERTHMSSLMVKLGDTHYCALIDTGAQVSCISQSLFRTLDLSLNTDVRFVIAGFGANNSPTLGVVDLTVGLPGAILEPLLHNFVVVEDRMMPFCVILGADYLLVQQVDLDFASKRYLQKGEPIPGQLMWTQGEVAAQSSFPLQIKFCRLSSQTRRVCIGTVGDDVDFEVARDSENNVTCLKSLITRDQIVNHQSRSKLLRALKRRLVSGQLSWLQSLAAFKRYRQRITLSDGVLLYTSAEGHQAYVIDFSLMVEVLLVVHYEMAHVGRQKLLDLVRRCVWNPGLSRVAGEVTSSCDCCQRLKVSPIIAPPIHAD